MGYLCFLPNSLITICNRWMVWAKSLFQFLFIDCSSLVHYYCSSFVHNSFKIVIHFFVHISFIIFVAHHLFKIPPHPLIVILSSYYYHLPFLLYAFDNTSSILIYSNSLYMYTIRPILPPFWYIAILYILFDQYFLHSNK